MDYVVINIIDTHNVFQTIEKFTQSGAPVLSYTGDESRFSAVMSSRLSFNILNETAEDGKFLDLLTGEERRFLIEVKKTNGISSQTKYSTIWRGFLLPDIYQEPYENGCFFVSFTATDGLDVLKTKPFLFYKTKSVLDYIVKCLWETGLDQEIYFAPGIENAFYDWSNIQLFEEIFTKYNESTGAYQYSDCFSVLEKLMKAIGATVLQHNGKWFIVGYNRKSNVLDVYKVYNSYGEFLRTEQFVKSVKQPIFEKGLGVSMKSPNKTVQFNVSYQESDKAVDFNRFVKNETLSSDEYRLLNNQIITSSIEPFNKWRKNAAASVGSFPEDGGTYLDIKVEGDSVIHHPDEKPVFFQKSPYCVTMNKVFGPPHNFETDYIELKPENTVYVSPQVEGKELNLDIDMEFKISSRVNFQKYNEDFYRQAFRIDILIGNDIVYSTRSDTAVYKSSDIKITYEAEQKGPKYMWWVLGDTVKPSFTFDRFSIPAMLKAEVQRKSLKTNKYGGLNVRVYIPRNGDDAFGFDDYHVYRVIITKLDIKAKAWDSEQYILNREIRYTTKYETDLDFSDGKNDLYANLFKINVRKDYPSTFNQTILFSGASTQDNLYYYFNIPGTFGDLVNSRYFSLKLYNGLSWIYAHLVFGVLGKESGIDFLGGQIIISKARIDEFPSIRDFLNGINKITVGSTVLLPGGSLFQEEVIPRENYISWKRSGSLEVDRYLQVYAKMIHECTAVTAVNLEATAFDIITPMDLVKFNYLGEKMFIPTSVSIDFSSGKTRLTLIESINQPINDYANT